MTASAASIDLAAPALKPGHSDRLPGLDGLRGLAILLLVLGHFLSLAAIGHDAVFLFFGLSGFLITRILLLDEQNNGRIDLSKFYLRRAFRILPPAYTYVLFLALLTVLGVHRTPWLDIVGSLAFF